MENLLNYLAGIVDGEGTIGISKVKRKLKENKRGYAYRSFFHITNTNLPLLQYLKKHFGGTISYLDKRAMCFNFVFSANKTREILPQLIPYLLVKRDQAKIVVRFLERVKENNFCLVSDDENAFYEECFLECKRLKEIRYDLEIQRVPCGMKKCIRCGNEFVAYSYGHKYCSQKCKSYCHLERTGIRKTD